MGHLFKFEIVVIKESRNKINSPVLTDRAFLTDKKQIKKFSPDYNDFNTSY